MMRAAGLAMLSALNICGQSFEVASIKIHPGPASNMDITTSGPRFRASAQFVGGLVLYAYNLKNYQLAWTAPNANLADTFFDIEAKAEGDAAPATDDFRQMLQSLLADRFKLKFHHEMREQQMFALVVGKNGPKFKESAPDTQPSGRHTMNGRNQIMTLTKRTMADVVQQLPVYTGRPVLDKTGLTGTYDLKMEATPFFRINNNPDPSDISIFVAIQDQLGLKLEPQKTMVEVLVVDHIEKPSEN
jgi:uncharacterized protein (TIGR03435 family)